MPGIVGASSGSSTLGMGGPASGTPSTPNFTGSATPIPAATSGVRNLGSSGDYRSAASNTYAPPTMPDLGGALPG